MIPVYVSNGAFITRHNGRDYHLIAKYAQMLDADGIEFLMYCVWKEEVEALRRFLKSTHLYFPVMHMDKEIGETLSTYGLEGRQAAFKLFERDLDTACEIGSKKLVMHLWNGANSDSRFNEALSLYADLHEAAKKRGLMLTTENVTCRRNLSLDHLLAIKAEVPDSHFTYDTKMARLHNENALLAEPKYIPLVTDGSICHLHVNDSLILPEMDRLPIMHIGDGDIDFTGFFELIKRSTAELTATIESTSVNPDGSVQIDRLNKSLAQVRQALNG